MVRWKRTGRLVITDADDRDVPADVLEQPTVLLGARGGRGKRAAVEVAADRSPDRQDRLFPPLSRASEFLGALGTYGEQKVASTPFLGLLQDGSRT